MTGLPLSAPVEAFKPMVHPSGRSVAKIWKMKSKNNLVNHYFVDDFSALQKENMEMSIIGKEIWTSGSFSIKPASPDHPIYTRGLVIGGRQLKPSPEKSSKSEKNAFKRKHEDDGGVS